MSNTFNVQDYHLIKTNVECINKAYSHINKSISFICFVLKTLFDATDDEINESITDTIYVGNHTGHDRGIDAIYINEEQDIKEIHIFNMKYTENMNKSKNNNFPSNEIDKVTSAISDLFQMNIIAFDGCNHRLKDKINEVYNIIQGAPDTYSLFVHLSSNHFKGLEVLELARMKSSLSKYSSIVISEIHLTELSEELLRNEKVIINAQTQYDQNDGFIKSDGNSRALIFSLNAVALLSMVSKNDDIRLDPNFGDLEKLKSNEIIDDAFDMNIRKYQKKRNRINKSIKETSISDERKKVFYYNNGITIICDKFEYGDPKNTVLKISNLQIVNGCQTVHSLYDALVEDSPKLIDVDILCRLYEINNQKTYSKIAEYTNSQTPVTGRDLKSNEQVQRKLALELDKLGYVYERKRTQHKPSDNLSKTIDSEKLGQLLMAFNNEMPGAAKNKKKLIFGDEYDYLFHDNLTAKEVLEITEIYNRIEKKRKDYQTKMRTDDKLLEKYHFIVYASFYILFVFSKIKKVNQIDNKNLIEDFDNIYSLSLKIITLYVNNLRKKLKERYSASDIFKNQGLKNYIDQSKKTRLIP